jgi:hypothetical protein
MEGLMAWNLFWGFPQKFTRLLETIKIQIIMAKEKKIWYI